MQAVKMMLENFFFFSRSLIFLKVHFVRQSSTSLMALDGIWHVFKHIARPTPRPIIFNDPKTGCLHIEPLNIKRNLVKPVRSTVTRTIMQPFNKEDNRRLILPQVRGPLVITVRKPVSICPSVICLRRQTLL